MQAVARRAAVMVVAEGLRQIMKQCYHDKFVVVSGLEHTRRRLQAMGVEIDRNALGIDVRNRRHRWSTIRGPVRDLAGTLAPHDR